MMKTARDDAKCELKRRSIISSHHFSFSALLISKTDRIPHAHFARITEMILLADSLPKTLNK